MKKIQELRRMASPEPKPQALAWGGGTLWMGSRQTKVLSAINPETWSVTWSTTAPGTPWGMTVLDGELRVLCGMGEGDDRFIRRCVPQEGFDRNFSLPCPDGSGSHLSFDGRMLVVSQWYPKKLISIDDLGKPGRVIGVPHGICGQVFVEGCFYLLTTDAEETDDYWITRVDPRPTTPKIEDLAHVPFKGRALAFDGHHFWTNHRERNEMVCFKLPGE